VCVCFLVCLEEMVLAASNLQEALAVNPRANPALSLPSFFFIS